MDRARSGQQLTQADIALVLRRAAELDRVEDAADRLDMVAVQAAAVEAGLSRASVCQALAELRVGALTRRDEPGRGLLGSSSLVVHRLVPGPLEAVRASLYRFLSSQLFELHRDFGDVTHWARRDGLVPALRRRFDVNHRLTLATVRHLQVALAPGQGDDGRQVMVNLVADVGEHRSAHASILAWGTAAAAGVTGFTAVGVGLDPLLLASLPVSVGLVAGSHRWGLAQYRRQVHRIETALAGLLDRLERRPALTAGQRFP